MKNVIACVLSLFVCAGIFAQAPRVAVADFDIDPGISRQEADVVYELFTAQLASTKKVTVADRVNLDKILAEMKFQASDWSNKDKTASMGKVINATALIRGRLMKMGNWIYWTATMLDLNTARVMYAARTRISDLGKAWDALPNFCNDLVGDIGKPTLIPELMTNIAVATFDVQGGITPQESAVVTELFIASLVRTGRINVIDRTNFDKIIAEMKFQSSDWSDKNKTAAIGKVLNAQNVIRGQLMKLGNIIYWVTTVLDVNTAEILSSSRQQLNNLEEVWEKGLLPKTSNEIVAQLPPPNFFLGRWQSKQRVRDTDLFCVLNIQADGTVIVERYDTITWTLKITTRVIGGNQVDSTDARRSGTGAGTYGTITKEGNRLLMSSLALKVNGIPQGAFHINTLYIGNDLKTVWRDYVAFAELVLDKQNSFSLTSNNGYVATLSCEYKIEMVNGRLTKSSYEDHPASGYYTFYRINPAPTSADQRQVTF